MCLLYPEWYRMLIVNRRSATQYIQYYRISSQPCHLATHIWSRHFQQYRPFQLSLGNRIHGSSFLHHLSSLYMRLMSMSIWLYRYIFWARSDSTLWKYLLSRTWIFFSYSDSFPPWIVYCRKRCPDGRDGWSVKYEFIYLWRMLLCRRRRICRSQHANFAFDVRKIMTETIDTLTHSSSNRYYYCNTYLSWDWDELWSSHERTLKLHWMIEEKIETNLICSNGQRNCCIWNWIVLIEMGRGTALWYISPDVTF